MKKLQRQIDDLRSTVCALQLHVATIARALILEHGMTVEQVLHVKPKKKAK